MHAFDNHRRLTADELVTTEQVLFRGLLIRASADGGDVSIYDGRDAGSGRHFGTFEGIATETKVIGVPGDVLFENGLFVDVGSDIAEVTVIYRPITPNE